MCNILCYHTMLSYQTTSFALLCIKFHKPITVSSEYLYIRTYYIRLCLAPAQHYHVCFVFIFCKSASSNISNMFVPMMMSMQCNNFRWHHQKESYSSYYHLTADKNGIIEHFLGLKQSQNGAQEASAPVNLACLWSNDECREGVRGRNRMGGGGWGRLRHVIKLSLVHWEKLNLHAFCSHIHRVNTKSIVKSCSGTWSTPICGEYFLYRSQHCAITI